MCPARKVVTDSELFGKRLRQVRESVGMKQVELARALEVDPKHLSRLERGKVNPSFEIIFRTARILNVSPSLFFDFEDSDSDPRLRRKRLQQLLDSLDGEQLRRAHGVIKALFEP